MNRGRPFKSGFIGIIGAPNVGKSTLLNQVVGQKIAITSGKPQTTRNRVMGILHVSRGQLIFLDTPGIHRAKGALNKRIVDVAIRALADANLAVLVIDGMKEDWHSEETLVSALGQSDVPAILAINKVDLMDKKALLPLIDRWRRRYSFESVVPISALRGENVDNLVQEMIQSLPEGPPYYPKETFTDVNQRFVASEIIREKVFRGTGDEIPYAVAVTIDSFKERKGRGITDVAATVYVERASQKAILIGRNGRMLKRIGEQARRDIEEMVGGKVFLKLWVRVRKNWTKDERMLEELGY
jgi:GTP-binding protein Era